MTSPRFPSEIPFGAFLQYGSKTATPGAQSAKNILLQIKRDGVSHQPPLLMTELVVTVMAQHAFASTPIATLLTPDVTLVPMPRSAPLLPKAVWGPRTICQALIRQGLGRDWRPLIERVAVIDKSAFIQNPADRPTPRRHYDTMRAVASTLVPDTLVLVDDLITKGATFAGAAARLREMYPDVLIKAFAIARTTWNFTQVEDPCAGVIVTTPDGSKATRKDADQTSDDDFGLF